MATYADTINGYYRQHLGRDASPEEIAAQTGGGRYTAPSNLAWASGQIANSQEARDYAARQRAATTPTTTTPTTTGTTGTTTTTTPNQVTNNDGTRSGTSTTTDATSGQFNNTGRGGTGSQSYSYTGFDFNQNAANRDTGKSAKYAFADATREAAESGVAASAWGTKAGAQEFAEKYLRPKLEAAGYKVLEIRGDKMKIVTREDVEAGNTGGTWVDFVVNADGSNPQLAWQPETAPDATDPTTPFYTAPTSTATNTTGVTAPTNSTQPEGTPVVYPANGMSDDPYASLVPTLGELPYYYPQY